MPDGLLYAIFVDGNQVGQVFEEFGGPFAAEGPGVRGVLVTEQIADKVHRVVLFPPSNPQHVDCAETMRPAGETGMNIGHVCYCQLPEDHWNGDDEKLWKHFCKSCKKEW